MAVILRVLLFWGSVEAIGSSVLAQALFGAVLVCSGIQSAFGDDEEGHGDFANSRTMYGLKCMFGAWMSDGYHHNQFFARNESGRLQMTMLGPVILVIGVTDFVFAFGSVASELGLMDDVFVR